MNPINSTNEEREMEMKTQQLNTSCRSGIEFCVVDHSWFELKGDGVRELERAGKKNFFW